MSALSRNPGGCCCSTREDCRACSGDIASSEAVLTLTGITDPGVRPFFVPCPECVDLNGVYSVTFDFAGDPTQGVNSCFCNWSGPLINTDCPATETIRLRTGRVPHGNWNITVEIVREGSLERTIFSTFTEEINCVDGEYDLTLQTTSACEGFVFVSTRCWYSSASCNVVFQG